MKNAIISAIIVIVSFIFQNTLCQYIKFGNIVPNLLLITVSSFGFIKGKKYGLLTGFFIGLLIDIYFFDVKGFHALLYMYIGYFNGFFKRLFYKDELKLQIFLVGCSDLIFNLVYYMLTYLLRGKFHFTYYLVNIIFPEVVYTILLTIFVFLIYVFWLRIFAKKEGKGLGEIV